MMDTFYSMEQNKMETGSFCFVTRLNIFLKKSCPNLMNKWDLSLAW